MPQTVNAQSTILSGQRSLLRVPAYGLQLSNDNHVIT